MDARITLLCHSRAGGNPEKNDVNINREKNEMKNVNGISQKNITLQLFLSSPFVGRFPHKPLPRALIVRRLQAGWRNLSAPIRNSPNSMKSWLKLMRTLSKVYLLKVKKKQSNIRSNGLEKVPQIVKMFNKQIRLSA